MQTCKYCQREALFQFKNLVFCCSKSMSGCPAIQLKKKQTCLDKYGDPNFKNHSKAKETKIANHGDANFNNRAKANNTLLEKYGVDNVSQLAEVKRKKQNTFNQNYANGSSRREALIRKKQTSWASKDMTVINHKRKLTLLEKYGVSNPLQVPDIKRKVTASHKATIAKRTIEESRLIGRRSRDAMVRRGQAVPENKIPEFKLYKMKVWRETNRSKLHLLENYEKRGVYGFHLDHKFSITAGFINNVPPEIIGHICNLTMLPHSENRSKYTKCSITLTELFNLIKNQK